MVETKVNLLGAVELIHRHMTAALCRSVFQKERTTEREREWTLLCLVRFWTAVVIRAPESLTQAVIASSSKGDKLWPVVKTTPEAFFQKCRDLTWTFFFKVYQAFTQLVLSDVPACYARSLGPVWKRFPNIWIVDGSRLDAIAHRLKILWDEKSVILPGCLSVFYDLARGVTREVIFSPDAAEAEFSRAERALERIPEGTLILGDRYYGLPYFFKALSQHGLLGLFRRNKHVTLRKIRVLSRQQGSRRFLQDALVEAGKGFTTPKMTLRWIRYQGPEGRRDLITSVLDPRQLSAAEALQLYPLRWTVERMFFDLKEVLNLHRFYAANPNAVAMQVYATAIVHTAFRVAQARIAQNQGIAPEVISEGKLFPLLAAASRAVADIDLYRFELTRLNPGRKWVEPNLKRMRFASAPLHAILVEKRRGKRRKRRAHPERKRWISFSHVKKLS